MTTMAGPQLEEHGSLEERLQPYRHFDAARGGEFRMKGEREGEGGLPERSSISGYPLTRHTEPGGDDNLDSPVSDRPSPQSVLDSNPSTHLRHKDRDRNHFILGSPLQSSFRPSVLAWRMHSRPPDKVSSPPKTTKTEDGKVRRPRTKAESQPPLQLINGKTYACESCKRGHRVQKCNHGEIRPISVTHQPGRPSGGQKRGCHCPRNCGCTTKTCKCERDCACTQEMFLIVRVDRVQPCNREDSPMSNPIWEDSEGNKMTLKKVWADADGRRISEAEYHERKRRMKEREDGLTPPRPGPQASVSSCCAGKVAKEEVLSPPAVAVEGGCRHAQAVNHVHSLTEMPLATTVETQNVVPGCTCGPGCGCLFCPEHPNNATSINHAQQQVRHMAENGSRSGQAVLNGTPLVPEQAFKSCMGGQPRFALATKADLSQQQLQQFFPDDLTPGAIYLRYPISQHSWSAHPSVNVCAGGDDHFETELYPDSIPTPNLFTQSPTYSSGTWNFSDGLTGNSGFGWTNLDASNGTDFTIGTATVASFPHDDQFPPPYLSPPYQTPADRRGRTGNDMVAPVLANLQHPPHMVATPYDPQIELLDFQPHNTIHDQELPIENFDFHPPTFDQLAPSGNAPSTQPFDPAFGADMADGPLDPQLQLQPMATDMEEFSLFVNGLDSITPSVDHPLPDLPVASPLPSSPP